MLRVVIRHVNDAEGFLLGEYPPSEVGDLVDLLDGIDLYVGADGDTGPAKLVDQQIVTTKNRALLEILVE